MKFRRHLLSRKPRNSKSSTYDRLQRADKWPAWKKNATLVKHISLLK